ncbi:permease-like cell division protein FtsX [Clostridium paraputrificum]|uniref:permease-like cell division protein FtsX n=1 Tax=Clostridium TaxID=1485 RepID=UPI003D335EB2
MKRHTVKNLVVDGAKNIILNRLVSFIALTTVIISLSSLGIFYSIIRVMNDNITNLQGEIKIVTFLNDDIEEDRVLELKNEIQDMDDVEELKYITTDEGLDLYKKSFEDDNDDEMKRIIDEVAEEGRNPIPATFEIKPTNGADSNKVKEKLEEYKEFYKVSDGSLVTEFLNSINKYVKILGYGLIGVLLLGAILLISNAIKVSVFVRRREIRIIKFIGATDNYVRLPFIIEGAIIGLSGSIISIMIISGLYTFLSSNIHSFVGSFISGFYLTPLGSILVILVPIISLIGGGIGGLGSIVSLKKYLDV